METATQTAGSTDGGEQSSFPSDTIRFIVPYGPGGGYDFYTRTVASDTGITNTHRSDRGNEELVEQLGLV